MKIFGTTILVALLGAVVTFGFAGLALAGDAPVWVGQTVSEDHAYFGQTVASDDAHLVVGSWPDAWVYAMDDNGRWVNPQRLPTGKGTDTADMVFATAIHGDTLILGVVCRCLGVPGHVMIFTLDPATGVWSKTADFRANDSGGGFGSALAFDGTTLLVGGEDDAVWFFTHDASGWTLSQEISEPSDSPGVFGASVALVGGIAVIGDVNGNYTVPGKAYVYADNASGQWQLAQTLNAPASDDFGFGSGLGFDGETLAISAPRVTNLNGSSGPPRVYMYSLSGSAWALTQTLDVGGNGYTGVVVDGDRALINDQLSKGRVYLFTRNGGEWGLAHTFSHQDHDPDYPNSFGASFAFAGANIVIGTDYENKVFTFTPANLALTLSGPTSVMTGKTFGIKAIVTNGATSASPAVALDFPTPQGANYVSASAIGGSCEEAANDLTCTFEPIEGNGGTASAMATFKATAKGGSTINAQATLAATSPTVSGAAAISVRGSNPTPDPNPHSGGGGGAFGWLALAALLGLATLSLTEAIRAGRGA